MNLDRLRALMDQYGDSQGSLARAVGATQGSIQQILAGTTQRSRLIPDIARHYGVSVDYLLGHSNDPQPQRADPGREIKDALIMSERVVGVQLVDLRYGMGFGTFIEDYPEEETAYFDLGMIQRLTRAPSTMLSVVKGIGDSMMPTLHDKDSLMIDRTRTQIDLQDRIWAVVYGDVGMVKRIRRLPDQRLAIMSDNPNVSDIMCDLHEVRVIGRVIWAAREV